MTWVDENQEKAVKAGGIEVILKTIKKYIRNDDIYEKGCEALANITSRTSKNTSPQVTHKRKQTELTDEQKAEMRKIGIGKIDDPESLIKTVIKLMNTCTNNTDMCHLQCTVLNNLLVTNGKQSPDK